MISVKDLSKFYGPHPAIQSLDFEIQAGEIVGFLGPNGAGKTTTMKILTGAMPATSGTIVVAGYDVFEHPLEVKREVGYLPEVPPLYPDMVVSDYLSYVAALHDVPRSQIRAAVRDVVQQVALEQVQGRLIGRLSKGYRQRVGLAQALIHKPRILILDEPTVGLDPIQILEIRKLIKHLGKNHTVILSSHILPEVTATCDRVIVINKGHIVAQDSIEALTARLHHTRMFILKVKTLSQEGLNAISTLHGVVKAQSNGDGSVWIEMKPEAASSRDQVLEIAVSHRMGVLEFAPEKISLEEVFRELTMRDPNTQTAVS